jgi:hypothetical protein
MLQVAWGGVPASAWAALAWAGLGTSFAAHSAVSWAVGRCSAVVPSIYSCMQVRHPEQPQESGNGTNICTTLLQISAIMPFIRSCMQVRNVTTLPEMLRP